MDIEKKRSPTPEDIINLRKSTDMTRKEFSAYLKIPYNTICDWESGDRKPPEYVFTLIKEKVERDMSQSELDRDKNSVVGKLQKMKEKSESTKSKTERKDPQCR